MAPVGSLTSLILITADSKKRSPDRAPHATLLSKNIKDLCADIFCNLDDSITVSEYDFG